MSLESLLIFTGVMFVVWLGGFFMGVGAGMTFLDEVRKKRND
jgi:hypothetical protein